MYFFPIINSFKLVALKSNKQMLLVNISLHQVLYSFTKLSNATYVLLFNLSYSLSELYTSQLKNFDSFSAICNKTLQNMTNSLL